MIQLPTQPTNYSQCKHYFLTYATARTELWLLFQAKELLEQNQLSLFVEQKLRSNYDGTVLKWRRWFKLLCSVECTDLAIAPRCLKLLRCCKEEIGLQRNGKP
jgi:hypothetical protein